MEKADRCATNFLVSDRDRMRDKVVRIGCISGEKGERRLRKKLKVVGAGL